MLIPQETSVNQFFRNRALGALRYLPIGMAATGLMGMAGARGDVRGAPAGMLGSIGGGARGVFSGGVLGAIGGVGLAAAAMFHPGTRQYVGQKLGNLLGSDFIRDASKQLAEGSIAKTLGRRGITGLEGVSRFPRQWLFESAEASVGGTITTPQQIAIKHTIKFLEQKRLAMTLGLGAMTGALAGATVGAPLGSLRKAYQSGQNI